MNNQTPRPRTILEIIESKPITLADILEQKNDGVRCSYAESLLSPPDVLEYLATDSYWPIRGKVAGNPNTPPSALEFLSSEEINSDEGNYIRSVVARNPNTPIQTLLKLLRNVDLDIYKDVSNNFDMPPDVLRLVFWKTSDTLILNRLARNPATPGDVLTKLADDHREFVREGAGGNVNTPEAALSSLSRDTSRSVRLAVAWNTSTPNDAHYTLSDDPDVFVRIAVGWNPETPKTILWKLSCDQNTQVRQSVASNPCTSKYLLECLLTDPDETVRKNAQHALNFE